MVLTVSITTNLEGAWQPDSDFYQESARTTTASNGDPIGSWSDQSGNARHLEQGTSSRKPTKQDGYVAADGIDDSLSNSAIGALTTAGGNWTAYFVFEVGAWANADVVWALTDGTSAERMFLQKRGSVSSEIWRLVTVESSNSSFSDSATGIYSETKQVFCLKFDGTNYTLYIDGTSRIAHSAPATLPATDTFQIGAQLGATNASIDDHIAHYFYTGAHNDTDRNTIEDELRDAYVYQQLAPDATGITLTVNNPTVANVSAQGLSPDATDLNLTVEQPTITNESDQSLSPNTVGLTLAIEQPTVSLEILTLEPDTVGLSLSVNNPTVSNDTAQGLSPDVAGLTLTINNPTIENTALSLAPDSVGLSLTVNNPTVANESSQSLSPDTVTLSLSINSATIANGAAPTFNYYSTTLSIVDQYTTELSVNDQYTTTFSIRGATVPYQIGQSPQLVALFKDNNVATNPTAVAVTVLSPTKVVTTPTASNTGTTGEYAFNITLDEIGTWSIRWVASGAVVDSKVQKVYVEETVFD